MKKMILIVLSICILAVQLPYKIFAESEEDTSGYNVKFNANGHGVAPKEWTDVTYIDYLHYPEITSNDGYTFGGWFTEPECINPCFPYDNVTENITLYAKWIKDNSITIGVGETITLSFHDLSEYYRNCMDYCNFNPIVNLWSKYVYPEIEDNTIVSSVSGNIETDIVTDGIDFKTNITGLKEGTTTILIKAVSGCAYDFSVIKYNVTVSNSDEQNTPIKIGDYVQMGTYYGQPILWRCVAFEKISGYDINGNPIIDSTDTKIEKTEGYLPLMLSDRILSLKAFDGRGINTVGSHGRGYYSSEQQDYFRKQEGSNYWVDSNIRDWLNSTASAGNVVWSCGNAPTSVNLFNGYNAYNNEAGFLTNFTQSERNAMKTVTQKSLLDANEYSASSNNYNSNYHQYNYNIGSVVQNYATAYSEQVTDTMFLLDVKLINDVYNNRGVLGNDYYIGTPTAEAVENSKFKDSGLSATTKWWSWLRSPYDKYSIYVRAVNNNGYVYYVNSYYGDGGVRPAFYLNQTSLNLKYGSGTADVPYSIEPIKSVTKPTASDITYGQTLSESTLSNGKVLVDDNVVQGTFSWKNGEKILFVGTHTEKVLFTPTDTTILSGFEIDVEVNITKADMSSFDVECKKTEGKYNFDIAINDDFVFENGILMLAGYSNGKLNALQSTEVTSVNRSASFEFDNSEIDDFKIILLDGFGILKPLTKAMLIKNVPQS